MVTVLMQVWWKQTKISSIVSAETESKECNLNTEELIKGKHPYQNLSLDLLNK
jgi:hypothetical protein